MTITINYYGILSDYAGCTSEQITIGQTDTVNSLQQTLQNKYAEFSEFPLAFFINNQKVDNFCSLNDGIVIECMPPFAGG